MTEDLKFDPANVTRLDAPDRREAIPQDSIVRAVEPFVGMTLADLGCGTGYFLWPLVEALGGQGTFYAVDSSSVMLERLRERAKQHTLGSRVTPLLSTDERVPLPAACLDVALLGSVYHELADRPAYLAEVRRLLKPGGKVVVIDWRPLREGEERRAGPPAHHRLTEDMARRELEAAGFSVSTRGGFDSLWCLVGVS